MVADANTIDILLRMQDFATKELRTFQKETTRTGRRAERSFDRVAMSTKRLSGSLVAAAAAAASAFGVFRGARSILTSGLGYVEAASAVEEANSKLEALFQEAAPKASREIDILAAKLGRSRGTLLGATADFGALLIPMGQTPEAASDISLALTELGQDLESFSNRPFEEAITAIRAGLIGSSEPLLSFGIDLREAQVKAEGLRLGLIEANEQLTEQQKLVARLSIINKRSAAAQGDVIRTADQYANTMRALKEGLKSVRVETGKQLIPVIKNAIDELGGAEAITKTYRIATRLLAFAFGGLIRGAVNLVKGIDRIVTAFSGADRKTEKTATLLSSLGFGIESVGLLTILMAEQSAAGFKLLYESIAVDVRRIGRLINGLIKGFNKLQEFFFGPKIPLIPIDEDAAKSVLDALGTFRNTTKVAFEAFKVGLARSSMEVARFQNQLASLAKAGKDVGEVGKGIDSIILGEGALGGAIDAALNEIESVGQRVGSAMNAAAGSSTQLGLALDLFSTGAMKAAETFGGLLDKINETPQFILGAKAAFSNFRQSLTDFNLGFDFANSLFQTFESGISDLSRRLVDSEASFDGWAKSLIRNIGAVITQFFLLRAIAGAFAPAEVGTAGSDVAGPPVAPGFDFGGPPAYAKGGVHQGTMLGSIPVNAYANGGIATSPQLALFGEGRGAEAFVPLPDGRSIPVTMSGGGGGANVTINLNAIDSKSGVEFLEANAKAIGDTISSQIEAGANRKLNRAVGRA
jgi:hypothetical protein